jgi:hypothetical protein
MHQLKFLIPCILICVIGWQCATQKKVQYQFPEAMSTLNHDSLITLCEKGKILYKEHCTGCHGIFSKGKDGVPNFTTAQIDMYKAKASLRDPTNHAVLQNMPFDQIDAIQLFLMYRKKE